MRTPEIEALAELARIHLTPEEKITLGKEVESILAYVKQIQSVKASPVADGDFFPLHNVMRDDKNPHQSGAFTENLLNSAPKRKENFIQVKKIF